LFWSPDSAFIGFVIQGSLKKVPVNGGPSETLATFRRPGFRGSWGRAGKILLADNAGALQYVPEGGGAPVDVANAVPGEPRLAATVPARRPPIPLLRGRWKIERHSCRCARQRNTAEAARVRQHGCEVRASDSLPGRAATSCSSGKPL
jgi:hypothetical protein